MKKIIYTLLIIIFSISFFSSCKVKTDYHKVMFEITFLHSPNKNVSNFIQVYVEPRYEDKKPYVDRFNIPQIWRYEYLGLEKGDKIYFSVSGQLSYYYEMRVYVDGVEMSYRRVKVSDYNYYAEHVEESRGINDETADMGVIRFTYN